MAAQSETLPAPLGGWNARDSLANMDPMDAITMTNIWPTQSDVMVRKGYSKHATGITGTVNSLIVYMGATSQKMFACAGANIYDVTAGGAVGAAVISTAASDKFQYQNIANTGGNYVLCVNGAEKLRGYNGTTWWQDGDASHDITGVDTSAIGNICLHMNRIWLLEKASLKAWYLGLQAIGGAATLFDLTSIARKGGYLVGMDAWTIDAGAGMNNYAAFFTSNGEVIVYTGTDPATATTWALQGVWEIGAPMGARSSLKWGGDLLLITYDGIVPMAEALQSSRLDPRVAISNKIYSAISAATQAYGGTFGWCLLYYPKANMLIINVPATGGSVQYVMNTITKSWAQFTGWSASCWALFNNDPYFGGSGYVGKAWDTFQDNGGTITGNCQQAFNYFTQQRTLLKRFTMAMPIFFTSGSPGALIGINTDFDQTALTGTISITPSTDALWDVAVWDSSAWSGGLTISKQWYGLQGQGQCGSINIQILVSGSETHWTATSVVFEQGAIL